MSKPKVAISWNASCGGCDESIVDIDEMNNLLKPVEKYNPDLSMKIKNLVADYKFEQLLNLLE